MNWEPYILRSVIFSVLLIGFYLIVLRNDTNYRAIRYFFLLGLMTILLLPLTEFTYKVIVPYTPNEPLVESFEPLPVEAETIPIIENTAIPAKPEVSINQIVLWLYLTGAMFFIFRFIFQLFLIIRYIVGSEKIIWKDVKVCVHPEVKSPFVLGNRIFVSNHSYFSIERQDILIHERIHLKQNHWIDMLLSELITMVFWFNPFVWYYGRLMKQNLEFIADRGVLDAGIGMETYLNSIICETMGAEAIVLANHFRDSRNKKRLKMMKKVKNSKWRSLKMLLLLPAIAMILWAFSKPEYVMDVSYETSKAVSDSTFICKGVITDWVLADTVDIMDEKTKKVKRKIIPSVSTTLSGTIIRNTRTNESIAADNKGEFQIKVISGDTILFAKSGFESKSIKVGDAREVTVELKRLPEVKYKELVHVLGKINFRDTFKIMNDETGAITQKIVVEGLPGVSVALVSPANGRIINGTVTDKEGNFEIDAKEGDELVFSFVGMKTEKVNVVDGKPISLEMKEQSILIDPGEYREKFKGKNLSVMTLPVEKKVIEKDISIVPPTNNNDEPVFFIVESLPKYNGGMEYFWSKLYAMANVKSKKGYKGTVRVRFMVTGKGEVKNVTAITNTGTKEAKAAEEIISRIYDWKPARQRGKAVDCWLLVDVEF